MTITQLLDDFTRTKDQIRGRTRFKVPSTEQYDGLSMAIAYSDVMEHVVRSLFDLTAETLGQKPAKGIGAFLYGSPGRREMVCESDLDMLLIYQDTSPFYTTFRDTFRKLAAPFQFCKIDLPDWGTLEEAATFAERSITEGNQVLESRFVCGDEHIAQGADAMQRKFGTPDKMIRNIVFQRFYFAQYFSQRVRNGAINVKYCDGGSRDYLFMHWFNQLMGQKYPDWNKTQADRPVAEIGLANLYRNGLISSLDFGKAIEALHFNLVLRNEILIANKDTPDEGMTYLDAKTLQTMYERMPELEEEYGVRSPNDVKELFNRQRFKIAAIKDRIWDLMIEEHGKASGSQSWASDFRMAYAPETSEKVRAQFLGFDDHLLKVGLIWGATNSGQKALLNQIATAERDSPSWEVQASLTSSPLCSPNYLHYVGTGIGKEVGYGYILRIVSRNQNVEQRTLEAIADDPKVQPRYKQCAVAALEHGKDAANHQI